MKPLVLFFLLAVTAFNVGAGESRSSEGQPDSRKFVDDRWSVAVTLSSPKQRYFYFRPRKEGEVGEMGYGLIVVLPGGRGDASQRPYYGNVYLNSVPYGFVMAQLVAVKWTPEQKVIWPSKYIPAEGMQFTTSEFVDAVITDVERRVEIDPRHVYLMGASSSGQSVYGSAVSNPRISGALVVASVFTKQLLPSLQGAKGKRFFLYQSPDDDVTRFHFAEAAATALRGHGAEVLLYSYPGGHNPTWPNNSLGVYGYAFHWLQGEAQQHVATDI